MAEQRKRRQTVFLSADNDLLGDYKDIPLYNVVLQAYVSPGALWAFVGIVMLFVLTMFVVSNVCVLICPTAVAENNELALLYNVDYQNLNERVNKGISNNPSRRMNEAFNNTLYCREEPVYSSGRIVGYRVNWKRWIRECAKQEGKLHVTHIQLPLSRTVYPTRSAQFKQSGLLASAGRLACEES